MGRREDYRDELSRRQKADWPTYLTQHSGLPGPRGNLELAAAVADIADPQTLDALIGTGDEYLVFCGVNGLTDERRLREHAKDTRWRIREAVAIALQRLGDPSRLDRIVRAWVEDDDPLVQRAAIAAICEPRLLRTAPARALALEACGIATASLKDHPRSDGRKVLRQALGYCWSVAIAADPDAGLPVLQALQGDPDPDVRWIVSENKKKNRLAKLLAT
jgi:HEAT repeat protein